MQPSSVFFDFMLHPVAAMGGLQEVRPSANKLAIYACFQ
jgi:hypothetical protein